MDFDIIIIGSGPGGYVAAIRASQLKMKVAVVEKADIGGVCLNWGCIPTKSLLRSAQVYDDLKHASDYGITVSGELKADFAAIIARSRSVAEGMSKGVQFLFRKNNITLIMGRGRLAGGSSVEIEDDEGKKTIKSARHIILATGARSKELPALKQDGKKIIGYREAMNLPVQPGSMVIVGSGAIGSEFANFYQSVGTAVTLVEFFPRLVPNEDEEVSRQLERSFRKMKMKIMTGSSVEAADISGEKCIVTIKTPKGTETVESDIVLSAVGVITNLEGLGLEEAGVRIDRDKVVVDEWYRTSVEGIYAIGDIVHGPALAHVASAEGIICAGKIAGLDVEALDYGNIPA